MGLLHRYGVKGWSLAAVLIGLSLANAPTAFGDAGANAKQMQGSWSLVSLYVEQDGKKTEPFGPNPKGLMILTPDGHMSLMISRPDIPKFAVNNRLKGTAEENTAVVQGSLASFGSYSISGDKGETLNLNIDTSTFPNWNGQAQTRKITLHGDELKLSNPTASVGGTAYTVWKRAK